MRQASYSELQARIELLEAQLAEFLSRAIEARKTVDVVIAAGCAYNLADPVVQELERENLKLARKS